MNGMTEQRELSKNPNWPEANLLAIYVLVEPISWSTDNLDQIQPMAIAGSYADRFHYLNRGRKQNQLSIFVIPAFVPGV